jgi:predicted RNase H-like HicB family nuclease
MFKKVRKITFAVEVCIEKDGDSYYAYCPALPGVHIDGETEEEAIKHATVAVKLYIESLIDHGDPIPLQIVQNASEETKVCGSPRLRSIIPCAPRQVENILVTV